MSGRNKRNRSNQREGSFADLNSLLRVEAEDIADDLQRHQMLHAESLNQTEEGSLIRKTKETYERFWIYFSSFYGQWTVTDESTLSSILNRDIPSRLRRPSGFPRALPQEFQKQIQFLWEKMIPSDIWDHVAAETSHMIHEIENSARINPERQRKIGGGRWCSGPPHGTPVEIEAMISASVIHAAFHSKISAEKYFNGKVVPGDPPSCLSRSELGTHRRFGISYNRFWKLRAAIDYDYNYVSKSLSMAFRRDWIVPGGQGCVVDEALMSCLAQEAPKIFIPRKPHSTGIRFYLICCRFELSKRTFCLDILPDLEKDKPCTVKTVLDRTCEVLKNFSHSVHLTADAFFGIKDLLENPPKDMLFTMSWNKIRGKDFWTTMFHGFEEKSRKSRVAVKDPFVASVFRDEGDMCVISNAFSCTLFQNSSSQINPAAQSLLQEQIEEETEILESDSPKLCCLCHRVRQTTFICIGCPNNICLSCPVSKEYVNNVYFLKFCTTYCRNRWRSRFIEKSPSFEDSSDLMPENECEMLATKLTMPLLKSLAKKVGLSSEGTKRDLAFRIGGWSSPPPVPRASSSSQSNSETDFDVSTTSSSSGISSSSTPGVEIQQREAGLREAEARNPNLDSLSDSELRKIVKRFKIMPKQSRPLLLKQAELLLLIADDPAGLEKLENDFDEFCRSGRTFPRPSKPLCHKLYGLDFNQVDQHNRRAYELFGSCKRRNWYLTCLVSLVTFAIANMHAWWNEKLMADLRVSDPPTTVNSSALDFLQYQLFPFFKTKFGHY